MRDSVCVAAQIWCAAAKCDTQAKTGLFSKKRNYRGDVILSLNAFWDKLAHWLQHLPSSEKFFIIKTSYKMIWFSGMWYKYDSKTSCFLILWAPLSSTLRASIWASSWQQCRQSGWSLLRLNSPSRSQELHSRLLENPSSLHASDDSSAPYADSWTEERKKISLNSSYGGTH